MISLILLDDSFNELRLFRSSCILLLARLSMMLHVAWSLEIFILDGLQCIFILWWFEKEFHLVWV